MLKDSEIGNIAAIAPAKAFRNGPFGIDEHANARDSAATHARAQAASPQVPPR
jgi:hypothetical protein